MNGMTTQTAVQNLDNLIATSRMTREEHVVLQQSLAFLNQKASMLDKQEQEKKDDSDIAVTEEKAEDTD